MTNFVKIQSGNFQALIRPENLAKRETLLAKVKPDYKRPAPKDLARTYPVYKPGMSTMEYVRAFEKANALCYPQHLGMTSPYQNLNPLPAAQYDPNVPLCVEDTNPDYVPGVDDAPAKPKRLSKQAAYIAELEWMVSRLAGFASHYASESAMLAGGADMVREARELIGGAK